MLELRKFVVPEFIFGLGAIDLAGRYSKNFGAKKVMVVSDPGVIASGWVEKVAGSLESEGIPFCVFSGITPNPKAEEVMEGAEFYRTQDCNMIVSVGGGSSMDCAKGIGIVSTNKKNVLEFEGIDNVAIPGPPLICIPTTAGSSADVSQFDIITDRQRKVKIAIVSKTVVPDVALIDPITTTTMDSDLTACTGIDALVHAIEAYVSNAHSPITDLHALEAIRLIATNLIPTIANPENIKLRGEMMLASLHAGLAFSNASLGAVHAMAHSLGGFLDTPHGESNAILLSHVIVYNFKTAAERYLKIGEALGLKLPLGREKSSLLAGLTRLRQTVGVDRTLSQMGVKSSDIPRLAEMAMQDACMVTNPRRPTQKDVEVIYEEAL
ncbi:MAG: iron-containing alcohol dehydrogenase [Deltaproteobacteria bacterium]|nr:iron-containing alcohol dehydrogenase [Deltaproteobacteria bacterium]